MNRIILAIITLTFLSFASVSASDFALCTERVDGLYLSREKELRRLHEEDVSKLESARDLAQREAFKPFHFRIQLAKLQAIRSLYKEELAESERLFKLELATLSDRHKEELSACLLEKKDLRTNASL